MGKHGIPVYYRIISIPLRLFFHLLYHSFAWSYDFVARTVSLGMWRDWVLSVMPDLIGPRILEIGHGTGWLQAAMLQAGKEIFGLDKSAQMGKLARKKSSQQGQVPILARATSQGIPFPSGSFDQAAATFPSEYIYEQGSLTEIHRVLKPGGTLAIIPVAWITGEGWLHRLAAGLFRVTGQAGEWSEAYLEPFKRAGFSCTVERRMVKSSQVLIILAKKIT